MMNIHNKYLTEYCDARVLFKICGENSFHVMSLDGQAIYENISFLRATLWE